MILPLLDALQTLSDAGLVHRDVKPENILFFRGHPYLGDISLLGVDAARITRSRVLVPPEEVSLPFGSLSLCPFFPSGDTRRKTQDERKDITAGGGWNFFLKNESTRKRTADCCHQMVCVFQVAAGA